MGLLWYNVQKIRIASADTAAIMRVICMPALSLSVW